MKVGDDEMQPCTEDEVRGLLPIQAYSQKQLSDVSVRVDELARFVNAPIRNDLGRLEREAKDAADRVRQSHVTKRRHQGLTQALRKRELEERSLLNQANALRVSLTGLSTEDRALLDRGKIFDDADLAVQSWRDTVKSLQQQAVTLQNDINFKMEQTDIAPVEPERDILAAAHAEYRKFLDDAKRNLDLVINQARTILTPTAQTAWGRWSDKTARV
jgi:chromosome segregation protein